ncbi:MAG TPA: hypothetical protein VKF41_09880 [Bryobacteraceae bacterium]|nr:hypothetical protein [Bryobacteraceae bacterium]
MDLQQRIRPASMGIALAAAAVLAVSPSPALADAGVFDGSGQDLRQVSSEAVQLVSINVLIVPGRGPFLFDGTVPGMDRAEYSCEFVLKNLTGKPVEVQAGFPVDSEFARDRGPVSANDSKDWVLRYGFIARDGETTYHVDFVRREPKSAPDEFSSLFVWKMKFDAGQTRTLDVQYRIPMAVALASTRKEETGDFLHPDFAAMAGLDGGMFEAAGYVTSTGSSWAGTVEEATFTLITEPFERYLNQRGWEDSAPVSRSPETAREAETQFPVHHPWWFRTITPDGWEKVEGGVQWRYKDFKPKNPIGVSYFETQFPRLPEEVAPFVKRVRKAAGTAGEQQAKLAWVHQILLATYGKEPEDASARSFAAGQLWYAPRKDFSMSDLSDAQKAVLKELDARIASAR